MTPTLQTKMCHVAVSLPFFPYPQYIHPRIPLLCLFVAAAALVADGAMVFDSLSIKVAMIYCAFHLYKLSNCERLTCTVTLPWSASAFLGDN